MGNSEERLRNLDRNDKNKFYFKRGEKMETKEFTPLVFLASLGAGGIAVMPFVLLQYTIEHGEGLITRTQLWSSGFNGITTGYYYALEAIMILFTILHFIMTFYFGVELYRWLQTDGFKEMLYNPLKNTSLLAPFISILMIMNVFIGPIRYFIPTLHENFQLLMVPAMAFWLILYISLLTLEIYILNISFRKGFDIDNISFGWLLHPFALGMLSVIGSGIAAMSKNVEIANTAAFLTLVSATLGMFLLLVKLIVLFRKHFAAKGLPEKQFLPSLLIVIPNITLYSITFFRLGHYLHNIHGYHLSSYFYFVIGLAFAFEIWYMIFGLSLLVDYFKKNHFNEFYVTQWGFICPFVAFAVLGGFAYMTVFPSPVLYAILVIVMTITVALFFELLSKHIKCVRAVKHGISCEV